MKISCFTVTHSHFIGNYTQDKSVHTSGVAEVIEQSREGTGEGDPEDEVPTALLMTLNIKYILNYLMLTAKEILRLDNSVSR